MIIEDMFISMSAEHLSKDHDSEKKLCRKDDFPVRSQWLKFLSLACDKCFNPYMPNRSGST
jgi:hypothetical protein